MFLECYIPEMRRFVVGLVYCAMLNVYKFEKDTLNDEAVPNTYLRNFINVVINNFYNVRKYAENFEQYMQIIA